jgi:hypothetical protein
MKRNPGLFMLTILRFSRECYLFLVSYTFRISNSSIPQVLIIPGELGTINFPFDVGEVYCSGDFNLVSRVL